MSYHRFLIILFLFCQLSIYAQFIPQPLHDTNLYQFLDELANDQLINISTVSKPYSRSLIHDKLIEAYNHPEILLRQKSRILILVDDFGFDNNDGVSLDTFEQHFTSKRPFQIFPPRLYSKSKFGKILIRPIYGIRLFNNTDETFYSSYGGLEMKAYLGKGWSVYGDIRDNYQQEYRLARPEYLTQEFGGNYKSSIIGEDGGEFSEMRGGITYSWEWGTVGLVKDHVQWGNHYAGANIFSGRTPSFPMVTLNLNPFKWLEFKYFHGTLNSEVVDSTRSYFPVGSTRYRQIMRRKHIAANLFVVSPWKSLSFSFGNSIIYSDTPQNIAYYIPFAFYKSLDHSLDDNQNSQLFFDLSFRGIKHLHLFSTLFIDELKFSRIFNADQRNFYSHKMGAGLSNWPVANIGFQADYTISSPLTYQHRVPTLTYQSNDFILGHFMGDNASSTSLSAWWRPNAKWQVNVLFEWLQKGTQHPYVLDGPVPVDENSFLENIIWEAKIFTLALDWSPISNLSVFCHLQHKMVDAEDNQLRLQFEPKYSIGNDNLVFVGLKYGFQ